MQTIFMLYPGAIALDIFGPFDALAMADELCRQRGQPAAFNPVLCALTDAPIRLANGVRVLAEITLCQARPDMVFIPGCFASTGSGELDAIADALAARTQTWGTSPRWVSICTGALALARMGLLDHRRATTHWAYLDVLSTAHPTIEVVDDALYVIDSNVWTSAGVTSGIDLALAMIREEVGAKIALEVARYLVVFAHRSGGQSQFSEHLAALSTDNDAIFTTQQYIAGHLSEDLSVERLAEVARMSPRNFARVFKDELSQTPGKYVQRVRLEAARELLEATDISIESIATRCGLGTIESLRRLLQRHLGVSPQQYRQRFRAPEE